MIGKICRKKENDPPNCDFDGSCPEVFLMIFFEIKTAFFDKKVAFFRNFCVFRLTFVLYSRIII